MNSTERLKYMIVFYSIEYDIVHMYMHVQWYMLLKTLKVSSN